MSLTGGAFLALWNDIAPARETEYDTWHTKEHVPERVSAQGFRGARRYVDRAREMHRYFTLYEVADLAAFDHADYRDLVEHPTPWSASMRADFANFLRTTCAVVESRGEGIGAALAVLAVDNARPDVNALLSMPGVTACHVGRAVASPAPAPAIFPSLAPRRFDTLLLVEALDRVHARAALDLARRALHLDHLPADFGNDVFDLAFAFPGHDAAAPARHRRPHWPR
jgi:hypothetical protein